MNSNAPKIFKEEHFYGHKIVTLSELTVMAQNVLNKYWDDMDFKVGYMKKTSSGHDTDSGRIYALPKSNELRIIYRTELLEKEKDSNCSWCHKTVKAWGGKYMTNCPNCNQQLPEGE